MKYNAVVEEINIKQENAQDSLKDWKFAIKDNINVLGTKTTASSALLQNYESIYNAEVVDRLLERVLI